MDYNWRYECTVHGQQLETKMTEPTVCQVDNANEIIAGSITMIRKEIFIFKTVAGTANYDNDLSSATIQNLVDRINALQKCLDDNGFIIHN